MKNSIHAVIFGIAIVTASLLLGNAYMAKYNQAGTISVTGLGQYNFTSDLIIWEARFEASGQKLDDAYKKLNISKNGIKQFLLSQNIDTSKVAFSAVQINNITQPNYSASGKYMGEIFKGYKLSQKLEIESQEVNKIEKVSRSITQLINNGITIYSQSPRYYYTKLAELKLEMISKATDDAYQRAKKIAQNAGGKLGPLQNAKMGVFQITGQNSPEDYSWGGTFNTSDKQKTASITMKLNYEIN